MVTATFLAATLLAANGSDATLLHFTADWCSACRTAEPTTQRLASEGYPIRRVDVDQQPDLTAQFRVTAVPCFVLVAKGAEIGRLEGAVSYARLVQLCESAGVLPGADSFERAHPGDHFASSNPVIRRPSSPGTASGFELPRPLASLAQSFSGSRALPAEAPRKETQIPPARTIAPPRPGAALPDLSADIPRPDSPPRDNPMQEALQATVRLRIDDAAAHSFGTGTLIDSHGKEALVVTCGHLFRGFTEGCRITVDVWTNGQPRTVAGTLISYDLDRDLGLVAITPESPVTLVRVAPAGFRFTRGQPVFSVGCDKGTDPTVRESRITGIDRYVGQPNVEVAGQPVDGRSGGGLFSADGFLIGVCNAADPRDNEGIFASLPAIHWELDRIGQQRIYGGEQLAQAPVARQPSLSKGTGSPPADRPPRDISPATDGDWEVICIVRSRANPQGSESLFVVNQPPQELLDRIASASQRPNDSAIATSPNHPPVRPFVSESPPVIRAQSNGR